MKSDSIAALPDGKANYAYLVRYHTTTDLTPDQIHDLGLAQVARIHAEMTAPVLSVSLCDAAMFRIGAAGGGPTKAFRLASGDVCALTGPARAGLRRFWNIVP